MMNQGFDGIHHPPGLPPRPSPLVSHGLSPTSISDRRRPGGLPAGGFQPNSLVTNFARAHGPSQAPHSATGALHQFTPGTPVALNDQSPSVVALSNSAGGSPDTPTTMEPYDPRQWGSRGQPSAAQMVFQQRGAGAGSRPRPTSMIISGNEFLLPSPPPPYRQEALEAPVTAVRVVNSRESASFNATPLGSDSSARRSPQPQVPMSPGFPPPPTQNTRTRERSTSGLANHLFGLPGRRPKQPSRPELPPTQPMPQTHVFDPTPPAARRAASTGHMHLSSPPSQQPSPDNAWQPGMPLPGPPPGPPPPNAPRSQSLNRVPSTGSNDGGLDSSGATGQHRRGKGPSNLGPIPPTPAHWIDSDHPPSHQEASSSSSVQLEAANPPEYQPLRINTGAGNSHQGLERSARREGSTPGIRERRSQSRAARDVPGDSSSGTSGNSKVTELISPTAEGAIARRREHARSSSYLAEPGSASKATFKDPSPSTPQLAEDLRSTTVSPPLGSSTSQTNEEPLKRRSAFRKLPGSASSDRPISQLLYMRNIDDAAGAPPSISPVRTPARPPSSNSGRQSAKIDPFYVKSSERYRVFLEKEASASSDEERLMLFANFITRESRLRRDRYVVAYPAVAGDILEVTRDLWRPLANQGKRVVTPSTSTSSFEPSLQTWAASDGQPTSAHGNIPSSASSFGDYTPATDVGSSGEAEDTFGRSESRQWAEGFKPSLSPIPSMAVSTTNDGDSSRGRKSSRWWEDSNSGSGSIGNPARIEKSQRETKYMGVSAAAFQGQASDSQHVHDRDMLNADRTVHQPGYGPNEYPPEKVGWHDPADFATPLATPAMIPDRRSSSGSLDPLDVSRLATLPPPFPRHHPASENNHPALAELRNEYRVLANMSEIRKIKDAYKKLEEKSRKEQQAAGVERRRKSRAEIQEKILNNQLTFAQAAEKEANFDYKEAKHENEYANSNFADLDAKYSQQLKDLIPERIQRITRCIDQLCSDLQRRNEDSDPNRAQEEGDAQPERLEQLNLLKWMFDTREQLHAEMLTLLASRSAKWSEVVFSEQRLAKSAKNKVDEATAFFRRDALDLETKYAQDAAARHAELQKIMEPNVSRGVEEKLSAFWDIAPGLTEIVLQVPDDLANFDIRIPEQEYKENPTYGSHPLQYLYSLLAHAEKSAYQFIKSQDNMLCLLNHVRIANVMAGTRLKEVEMGWSAKGADPSLIEEVKKLGRMREAELMVDLQEKVGEVKRQWKEALGATLVECKGRVKDWLEVSGGWEDGLEGSGGLEDGPEEDQ